MAKKRRVNKSELVRNHASAHPGEKPKQIAESLSKQHKITLSPQQVSTILTNARKITGEKKSARKMARPSKREHVSNLDLAVDYVSAVGGLAKAELMLTKLREIKDRL